MEAAPESAAESVQVQHPWGPYILDFYCPQSRVAVELDGEYHADSDQVELDEDRMPELKVLPTEDSVYSR